MSSKLYINFLFFLISKKNVFNHLLFEACRNEKQKLHIKPLPEFGGAGAAYHNTFFDRRIGLDLNTAFRKDVNLLYGCIMKDILPVYPEEHCRV